MIPPVDSSSQSSPETSPRAIASDLEKFRIDVAEKLPETPQDCELSPERFTPLFARRRGRSREVARKLDFSGALAPSTPVHLQNGERKNETPEGDDFYSLPIMPGHQEDDFLSEFDNALVFFIEHGTEDEVLYRLLDEEYTGENAGYFFEICVRKNWNNLSQYFAAKLKNPKESTLDQAFCMSDEEDTSMKCSSSLSEAIPIPFPEFAREETPPQEMLLSSSVPARSAAPVHRPRPRTKSSVDPDILGTSPSSWKNGFGSYMPS